MNTRVKNQLTLWFILSRMFWSIITVSILCISILACSAESRITDYRYPAPKATLDHRDINPNALEQFRFFERTGFKHRGYETIHVQTQRTDHKLIQVMSDVVIRRGGMAETKLAEYSNKSYWSPDQMVAIVSPTLAQELRELESADLATRQAWLDQQPNKTRWDDAAIEDYQWVRVVTLPPVLSFGPCAECITPFLFLIGLIGGCISVFFLIVIIVNCIIHYDRLSYTGPIT